MARLLPIASVTFAFTLIACAGSSLPPLPPVVLPVAPPPRGPSAPGSPAPSLFTFEPGADGAALRGWSGNPSATIAADDQVVHGGRWSARLRRDAASASNFSMVAKSIPIDFAGKTLELRGYLKTDAVSGFAGLWLREDGDEPALAFDNMQAKKLEGTTDWTEYSIVLPLVKDASQLVFGALVDGTGTLWADGLRLFVDGKPVSEAPRAHHTPTVIETDHEFDHGSGVTVRELSKVQVDDLVLLGKVWGLLKYHHPVVTAGQRHWDYDLFRVLPKVLAATDRSAGRDVIATWVAGLGEIADCTTCAKLAATPLAIKPDLAWISDDATLGPALSRQLLRIVRNRPADGKQFYVSMVPGVGNPAFEHEPAYRDKASDPAFRLLAVFRFWNMVQYWFPYRDLLGRSWDAALRDAIPRVMLADSPDAYARELIALIARVHDSHANLWSSLDVRPPTGKCHVPAELRFVEKSAVVADGKKTDLKVGDVIVDLDGASPLDTATKLAPLYASSNDASRLRDFAEDMTRGECVPASLRVKRDGKTLSLTVARVPIDPKEEPSSHDRQGPTFQKLSDDVAYLKLSSIKAADIPGYLQAAAGTKGLVIDIRNYPSEFVVFDLGSHLVDHPTPFVTFTVGDLRNPGSFRWRLEPLPLPPAEPHYTGKVAILVDETSQSQAEYTTMAFRASPHAVVIGSTTAGADGNVSTILLPGGLGTMFSGIGIFYPDHRPTQRIGIVPDIRVEPTIAGLRAGRDEVLEAALRHILGPTVPSSTLQTMAKRPSP
jgi:C-terminal processing protease CtpA/Prc